MATKKLPVVQNMAVMHLSYTSFVIPIADAVKIIESLEKAEVVDCTEYTLTTDENVKIKFSNTGVAVNMTTISKKTYETNKMDYILGLQDTPVDEKENE